MLPKQAKFDLKCSKKRLRQRLRPKPRWVDYGAPKPLIVRDKPLTS